MKCRDSLVNYTPVDPKQFFHIHRFNTSSWCWQFWIQFNWEQHGLQATLFPKAPAKGFSQRKTTKIIYITPPTYIIFTYISLSTSTTSTTSSTSTTSTTSSTSSTSTTSCDYIMWLHHLHHLHHLHPLFTPTTSTTSSTLSTSCIFIYIIYHPPSNFRGDVVNTGLVNHKKDSRAWGYRMGFLSYVFSQHGLSYKMPLRFNILDMGQNLANFFATKCPPGFR